MFHVMCNQHQDCIICPDSCRLSYTLKGYWAVYTGSRTECHDFKRCE